MPSHPQSLLARLDRRCRAGFAWLAATPWRALSFLALLCLALYIPGQMSLPPTDRDESRFAQASKQMLETGNFVDIRFQGEPRYKKPIGIYWLQSAAVSVAGNGELNNIWAYRIPSLLGIIAAVLLTWAAARPIFGRETALLAALALAGSVTMALEARIAKSDAVLLATIVAAQAALARLYLLRPHLLRAVAPRTALTAALFWLALGASALIKGPIGPGALALTIATVVILDRDRSWLRRLHAGWGIPLMLAVVLPWLIAITFLSEGAFLKSAAGGDFLAKFASGQESHGAPPGTYFLLFWLTFWPGTLLATGAAAMWLWRRRMSRRALLLIAGVVPYWLAVEFTPTKLPHYILPVYPFIAIAAAWAITGARFEGAARMLHYRLGAVLWAVIAAGLIAVLGAALWLFEADWRTMHLVLAAGVLIAGAMAVAASWQGRFHTAMLMGLAATVCLYTGIFRYVLPELRPLWPAVRTAEAAAPFKACLDGPVAFAGFGEPSAVFVHGTRSILTGGEHAAAVLRDGRAAYAFVTDRDLPQFQAALDGKAPPPLACVNAFSLNGRGVINMKLYSLHPPEVFERCRPDPAYACRKRPVHRWRQLLSRTKTAK